MIEKIITFLIIFIPVYVLYCKLAMFLEKKISNYVDKKTGVK